MLCPQCGDDNSRVIKTRASEKESAIFRVRECCSCEHVWRTREVEFRDEKPKGDAL
jgi:transcriptional regulator NrdR family protein